MLDFENPTGTVRMSTMYLTITDDQVKDVFAVEAKGEGMVNAGINNGDMLFFLKCNKFRSGEIVAVNVNGEDVVRRIYKGRNRVKLCRETGKGEYTFATDYTVYGRLVGIQRKLD